MSILSNFRRGIKRTSSQTSPATEEHVEQENIGNSAKHLKTCHDRVFHCAEIQQNVLKPPKILICDTNKFGSLDERTILFRHGFVLIDGKLGSGRYCKVRLAEDVRLKFRKDTNKVAVKIVDTTNVREEFLRKFLPREIGIWPQLKHPNLVRMHQHFQCGTKHFMILEYVPGGDLLSFVQNNGAQSEGASRVWMKQLISAVSYLHSRNTAHRDLKLENILIGGGGDLKITDFGFCRQMSSGEGDCLSQTYCGSKAYSAPEILDGSAYDPKRADVWSLGVIAFILVTGYMPYNEHVTHQSAIVRAQRDRAYHYPSRLRIPQIVQESIDEMMTFQWEKRPNIEEVKRLGWFTQNSPSSMYHRSLRLGNS